MAVTTAEMIGRTLGRPMSRLESQLVKQNKGGLLSSFATGGEINRGQLSVVGEEGPELFVPQAPGAILPNPNTMRPGTGALGTGSIPAPGGYAAPASAGFAAPAAPQTPQRPGSGLVRQLSSFPTVGGPPAGSDLDSRFAAAGLTLPAGLMDRPSQEGYMKEALATIPGPSGLVNPSTSDLARYAATYGGATPADLHGYAPGATPGGPIAGAMMGQNGPAGPWGAPGGQPTGGAMPSTPGGGSALEQALMAGLTGQNAPTAAPAPDFDPALTKLIADRAAGIGVGPSYQDIISGSFEPMAALMDQQFKTAQTDAFEQLVSRGVLQSGETTNTITRMAAELGMSKGALLGQLSLDYAKQRNEQINSAIQQWGILEGQRASNAVTISTANLGAAVQIQSTAMQTLTNLTTAMAQIASAEKISGAEIAGRKDVAGIQVAGAITVAGMDNESRQAIAQMQTAMQYQVAQLGAQSALQIAGFDNARAHEIITSQMALEGIDWNRFQSDPEYATNVTNAIAIEKDIHLAIDQADAAGRQLSGADQAAG